MDNDIDETFTSTFSDTDWLSSDEETPHNSPIAAEVTGVGDIAALDAYFEEPARAHLSCNDFQAISRILDTNGKSKLAKAPRLFWIFQKLNRLDVLIKLLSKILLGFLASSACSF
jgi:hypothetical protein